MTSLNYFGDLPAYVEQEGGVALLPMKVLRDMAGAGRIGRHVKASIERELRRRGLCPLPRLPDRHHQLVAVVDPTTPSGGRIAERVRQRRLDPASRATRPGSGS